MLVHNMNYKRQRKPNVRLWEVGDLPAAFACDVSKRFKSNLGQRSWKDDPGGNNDSTFPHHFPHEFGFTEFSICYEKSADRANMNLNSLNTHPDLSSGHDDEANVKKDEQRFREANDRNDEQRLSWVTRKPRLSKRRRRSLESLFLDPWGSATRLGTFVAISGEKMQAIKVPLSTDEGNEVESEERVISSSGSVGEWLEEIGFGKYAELFEMHEVDKETLPLLTLNDLKEMGIFAVGIRRKLFDAIKTIREVNMGCLLDEKT
ncbi:unnamed protein product [Cuscuta epithymum]|uniref:SAM domain-containing protein n=1 Tax=Cuscuta epithymum TaxID=186058 RepID=A0AAV0G8K0_9ASTE|nr:unnamed protein product [Cuscuta epithymum]CAH9143857.1 unnamed protein product [Cuscuta epithymum]